MKASNKKADVEEIKDVLQLLSRAVSAVKIYPSDHSSIRKYIDHLEERLTSFLEDNQSLEIGIEEFRFTFEKEPVFEEMSPMKSLPFFFSKDGMKSLIFYRGLDREELQGFLEVIKKVSQLPPDEADIVNALWEKDFPDIRYFAPDEFLETRITTGKKSVDISSLVRTNDLVTGRIDMLPEDLDELRQSRHHSGEGMEKEAAEKAAEPDLHYFPLQISQLDEKEMAILEKILQTQRNISSEEEFVNVIVEVVFLEDRSENFPALSESLRECHQALIRRGHFVQARLLIDRVREMKDVVSLSSPPKVDLLAGFLNHIASEPMLREVKEFFLQSQESIDLDGYFLYLSALVPESLQMVSDLFASTEDVPCRQRILKLLEETAERDLKQVTPLAVDSRPVLSIFIIGLISRSRDLKAVSYLTVFLRSSVKEIRMEAIRALGLRDDPKARLILLKTLGDADEDLRIAAASNLCVGNDRNVLEQLIPIASSKIFKKKIHKEKQAILACLGRSKDGRACSFLRGLLLKKRIIVGRRHMETKICAASALEGMATAEAVQALKEGSRSRKRKIREACQASLRSVNQKST